MSPGTYLSRTWLDPERSHGLTGPATHDAIASRVLFSLHKLVSQSPVLLFFILLYYQIILLRHNKISAAGAQTFYFYASEVFSRASFSTIPPLFFRGRLFIRLLGLRISLTGPPKTKVALDVLGLG